MGYIEELAAREAARQEANRGKQFEASRVLNQGNPGLAARVADPYVNGISQEDMYRLAMAEKAGRANEYGNIMDMIEKNREFQKNKRTLADTYRSMYEEKDMGWGPDIENADDNTVIQATKIGDPREAKMAQYLDDIDPGLAAKWMESYKGR